MNILCLWSIALESDAWRQVLYFQSLPLLANIPNPFWGDTFCKMGKIKICLIMLFTQDIVTFFVCENTDRLFGAVRQATSPSPSAYARHGSSKNNTLQIGPDISDVWHDCFKTVELLNLLWDYTFLNTDKDYISIFGNRIRIHIHLHTKHFRGCYIPPSFIYSFTDQTAKLNNYPYSVYTIWFNWTNNWVTFRSQFWLSMCLLASFPRPVIYSQ